MSPDPLTNFLVAATPPFFYFVLVFYERLLFVFCYFLFAKLGPNSGEDGAGKHAAEGVQSGGDRRGRFIAKDLEYKHGAQARVLHADFQRQGSTHRNR